MFEEYSFNEWVPIDEEIGGGNRRWDSARYFGETAT